MCQWRRSAALSLSSTFLAMRRVKAEHEEWTSDKIHHHQSHHIEGLMWMKFLMMHSTRNAGDAEAREDADVLVAAREALAREDAKRVAAEKRKRKVDAISEEVTKKVKAEIQSLEFIQMLANAIVSLLLVIATRGAGEREQIAGEKDKGCLGKTSARAAGDNQAQIDGEKEKGNLGETSMRASGDNKAEAASSNHIQMGLMIEQPLHSQLPNT